MWDDEVDVLVVGFGGAGVCAAIEAAECGVKVMAVDAHRGGGATAISGGVVYGGGGSPWQTAAQVEDSAEAMFDYLQMEVGEVVSTETLRVFCDQSRDMLLWLNRNGVPFEGSLCPVKTSYPSNDYYLYHSGNESVAPYRDKAAPAPRGHRAKGRGLPGANFYEPLRASALAAGVEPLYQTEARRLVVDGDGRVMGAELWSLEAGSNWALAHHLLARTAIAIKNYNPQIGKQCHQAMAWIERHHAKPRRVKAQRGVILSAGGFIYNRAMVEHYAPQYRPGMPLGTVGCNGSGIQLGQSVDGATAYMDRASAWRFINPPEAWTYGVLVDKQGQRYVNERLYGATVGRKMVEEHRGEALLIIDASLWRTSLAQVAPGQKIQWFQQAPALLNLYANCREGDTVEELAARCRIPAETLRQTVDAYNALAHDGQEDPLGKDPEYIRPLQEAPFYAIDCSLGSRRFPCPTLTLGGLVVDETTGHVKREDGSRIEGLFAAGRTAVGLSSNAYVSGLSLADCVYSGRRAGRHAAQA
ncbi:MAG: FAD-binding protein [Myxococcota bacterium]